MEIIYPIVKYVIIMETTKGGEISYKIMRRVKSSPSTPDIETYITTRFTIDEARKAIKTIEDAVVVYRQEVS